ncbi:hypothetical protein HYH03_000815 [Edaphochlamys debaryana]|uniref:Uncharacterized protein n=1 Tax=Edaphochlamys debaryana TaxID=47281 RepID=A0A835YGX1_9CHLO|nr:hypothetical protein HYH03_000815 [Edaphochlamys debaryana]|eukprot:KAG2500993.1 hypothetical protein HYH03_000815 [Edaphochlamys debaryana]
MRPGALLVAALLALVSAGASGDDARTFKVYGGRHWHPQSPKDYVRTYVRMPKDYDDTTLPAAVGVDITRGFLQKSDQLLDPPVEGKPPNPMSMPLPDGPSDTFNYTIYEGNLMFPQHVGYQPFKYLFWATQHYDLHFMLEDYDYWQKEWDPATSKGPCLGYSQEIFTKTFTPVPETCFPGGKSGAITNIGNLDNFMGSHLVNLVGEEWSPAPKTFDWAQIFGQYGGRTVFFEPMFSTKYMLSKPGFTKCIDLSATIPLAMPRETVLPTQLCVEAFPKRWQVEYRNFKRVPGNCEGSAGYQGVYPVGSPIAAPVPAECPIPQPPAQP